MVVLQNVSASVEMAEMLTLTLQLPQCLFRLFLVSVLNLIYGGPTRRPQGHGAMVVALAPVLTRDPPTRRRQCRRGPALRMGQKVSRSKEVSMVFDLWPFWN